jgi:hypothetical protein
MNRNPFRQFGSPRISRRASAQYVSKEFIDPTN